MINDRNRQTFTRVPIRPGVVVLFLLFWLTAFLPLCRAAGQGGLSGMITDEQTQLPIAGATVVAAAPGGEPSYRARTDGFGRFHITPIPPGTYDLEASHPGYHSGADSGVTIAATVGNRWQKSLILKEPFIDVFVEVACVTTGMKLDGVPVRITAVPANGGNAIERTGSTDALGVIHFTGLPAGFYSFFVNEGANRVPGWESFSESIGKELTGPHWADVLLKPEKRQLTATVYGFDPVTEEESVPLGAIVVECEGVHPDDHEIVLVPALTGVSGIRKADDIYWDNTMAAKVVFTDLPPIDWMVSGKRLGYDMSQTLVTADAAAQLVPDHVRLDMVLQDTRLTLVLETPYNDPEMLAGLEVRLQGLDGTGTAGIDRTRTAQYRAEDGRAVVVFDRLLPGNYLVGIDDTVTKTVPVLVDGVDVQAGKTNPSNRFTVHFIHTDYLDAAAGVDRQITVALSPLPARVTGAVGLADVPVEIRASQYYSAHMPQEAQFIQATTDHDGMFSVTLPPGLYGFRLPGVDDYAAFTCSVLDKESGVTTNYHWPYDQIWPFGLASALSSFPDSFIASSGGLGGIGFSSGRDLLCSFTLWKKQFQVQITADEAQNHPLVDMVVYYGGGTPWDGSWSWSRGHMAVDMATRGTIRLVGPETLTAPFMPAQGGSVDVDATATIQGTVAGTYSIVFEHPDLEIIPGSLSQDTFVWDPDQFPVPGYLPATEPTSASTAPYVSASLDVRPKAQYAVAVEFWKWVDVYGEGPRYVLLDSREPDFISFQHSGDRVFKYHGAGPGPYSAWYYVNMDGGRGWYRFESEGGDAVFKYYFGGPTASTLADFSVDLDLMVEARNMDNPEDIIEGARVTLGNGEIVTTPVLVSGGARYGVSSNQITHPAWSYVKRGETWTTGQSPQRVFTVYMRRGHSVQGEVVNAETGRPVPGAQIKLLFDNGLAMPGFADGNGTFLWPYSIYSIAPVGSAFYLLDVRAEGFLPRRVVLDPAAAVQNPDDPRTAAFLFTGENAIGLTPLRKPSIAADSLAMNRRGAFLPGVKKAGNQTVFTAFNADGPLTMTWSLDVGLLQQDYNVTLPGLGGAGETLSLRDAVSEVWLVDLKAFADNPYNDLYTPVTISAGFEPHEFRELLANIASGAPGFENVFHQRLTGFTPLEGGTGSVRATGTVKLWQLPPDQFRPAFVVLTKLGAAHVVALEYKGAWEGRELTGARLPEWFSGMAEIMGSVAGSQAMMGQGLADSLPRGKFIAMPSFTANIVLRASGALDYVYAIDTQIREGMANSLGGIMGLAPGFLGLSFYGGAEATLKGEDREFYLQIKGGLSKATLNRNDYRPAFLKKYLPSLKFTPPPSGEFYHIDDYKFDPDNNPAELAVLYGMSGQAGIEVSATIVPVLQYIPKIGPILLALYQADAMDVRALTKGIAGVRSLSGFKTTFPRHEEHYAVQGPETRQWRRHFLGGNEIGDVVTARNPQETESLDVAFGFGVGLDVWTRFGLGARGTIELSGDDSWTGAPTMLIDTNPNGDFPYFTRARGDIRAVLEAYLDTWVARFRKQWIWKGWPIDYQFGTESVMYLIEMDIVTQRRDLADYGPATFDGQELLLVDDFIPTGVTRTASQETGALLLYTDMSDAAGQMAVRACLRDGRGWATPVEIARTQALVVDAAVIGLPDGGGWLAVWTEIDGQQAGFAHPSSRIVHSVGSPDGATWSLPSEAAALENVAENLRLIRHGDAVAVLYTKTPGEPGEENDGVSIIIRNADVWTAPESLVTETVAAFTALGSDDPGLQPSLLAWTTPAGELYLAQWTDAMSAPLRMRETAGNALALARYNDRTFLAWSGVDGGIGLFHRDASSGPWTDRGIVFDEAVPRELSLCTVRKEDRDLIVAAWIESDGTSAALHYGVMDAADDAFKAASPVMKSVAGNYRSPALLTDETGGAVLLGVIETEGGVRQLHAVRLLDALSGDIDMNGRVDLADLFMTLKILANTAPDEIPGRVLADADRDGRVGMGDALHILRTVAGL